MFPTPVGMNRLTTLVPHRHRGCPDGSGFDATVCRGEWFAIIRDAAIFKEQTNRFGDRRLIVFGGKHIMRGAFFDQIVGQFVLCQQGSRFWPLRRAPSCAAWKATKQSADGHRI